MVFRQYLLWAKLSSRFLISKCKVKKNEIYIAISKLAENQKSLLDYVLSINELNRKKLCWIHCFITNKLAIEKLLINAISFEQHNWKISGKLMLKANINEWKWFFTHSKNKNVITMIASDTYLLKLFWSKNRKKIVYIYIDKATHFVELKVQVHILMVIIASEV